MSLSDLVSGAAGNAGKILKLREAYNAYVEGGGTLSFDDWSKEQGVNPNPYKTSQR